MTPARCINKLRGQPQKLDDATVGLYEWVVNARCSLTSVQNIPQASKAALLIDNLGGCACQEIVGRGMDTSNSPVTRVSLRRWRSVTATPTVLLLISTTRRRNSSDMFTLIARAV